MNQSVSVESLLANLAASQSVSDDAPKFQRGDHVATSTGKVHVVGGNWGPTNYAPCATSSGSITRGTKTDAKVTCKTCAKHVGPDQRA